MKLNELPQDIQDKLIAERNNLKGKLIDNAYSLCAYNQNGTRFFMAQRVCIGWQDNETGNSMPFGGGTYWKVLYGTMQWQHSIRRDPLGYRYDEYKWVKGKLFNKVTNTETGETIDIMKSIGTKKEVMALLKKLEFMGFTNLEKVK